jgi:uncharacterized protein YraI
MEVSTVPVPMLEVERPAATPALRGTTRVVTTYRLNLRPQPGADDANQPIATLKRGDRVRLLGGQQTIDGGMWVQVEADGIEGWVNSRFLEEAP